MWVLFFLGKEGNMEEEQNIIKVKTLKRSMVDQIPAGEPENWEQLDNLKPFGWVDLGISNWVLHYNEHGELVRFQYSYSSHAPILKFRNGSLTYKDQLVPHLFVG